MKPSEPAALPRPGPVANRDHGPLDGRLRAGAAAALCRTDLGRRAQRLEGQAVSERTIGRGHRSAGQVGVRPVKRTDCK